MEMYYQNSDGIKLNLLKEPYRLQTGDIFDYSWDYDTITTVKGNQKIKKFLKLLSNKKLLLSISARSEKLYYEARNHFFETTEKDVLSNKPGKLYVGNQYLSCYLVYSSKRDWEYGYNILDYEVALVIEQPFWITEKKYQFLKTIGKKKNGEFLDYPYGYPYDYTASVSGVGHINNTHISEVDFEMIIYGPVINPRIRIGKNLCEVVTNVGDGEYLVINSEEGTAKRVRTSGVIVDEFDNRNKKISIFDPIQTGDNLITWDGTFGIDLTLFEKRSEPKC